MIAVIITAAGFSTRMGGTIKKEYLPFKGGTVLSETVKTFLTTEACSLIVITVPFEGESDARKALFRDTSLENPDIYTKFLFVTGGSTRQQSVRNALEAIEKNGIIPDIVLIHDGARPFVTPQIIHDTEEAAEKYGASAPAVPPVDTQKERNAEGFIAHHLQRDNIVAVQTPQAFRFKSLLEAHRKASKDGQNYTDDTEIWDRYEGKVKLVAGDNCNKKITWPSDLLQLQPHPVCHTGLGYDIHPLIYGRPLLIGGIHIPFDKGENGHSDGDVLLHAITDALLGASHLGDIGSFFDPDDDTWKNADSSNLLSIVWQKIIAAGWELGNLDCVIKLEKPKFIVFRDQVRISIAKTLGVSADDVFVKAKTGEKMDSVGNENAIEAWCTCLLWKK
jgi:2-C-methyl-D-erythritol 4-phosphate cytidylyltransferase / 2-C-methyl-D-erythritol 2,4-cyclodiphosphate synthase